MKRVENQQVVEVISTRDRRLTAHYEVCFLAASLQFRQQHGILSNLPMSENNQPISECELGNPAYLRFY